MSSGFGTLKEALDHLFCIFKRRAREVERFEWQAKGFFLAIRYFFCFGLLKTETWPLPIRDAIHSMQKCDKILFHFLTKWLNGKQEIVKCNRCAGCHLNLTLICNNIFLQRLSTTFQKLFFYFSNFWTGNWELEIKSTSWLLSFSFISV